MSVQWQYCNDTDVVRDIVTYNCHFCTEAFFTTPKISTDYVHVHTMNESLNKQKSK